MHSCRLQGCHLHPFLLVSKSVTWIKHIIRDPNIFCAHICYRTMTHQVANERRCQPQGSYIFYWHIFLKVNLPGERYGDCNCWAHSENCNYCNLLASVMWVAIWLGVFIRVRKIGEMCCTCSRSITQSIKIRERMTARQLAFSEREISNVSVMAGSLKSSVVSWNYWFPVFTNIKSLPVAKK